MKEEIIAEIMKGKRVSLLAEDKDEREIDKVVNGLRSLNIGINCNISFTAKGSCKVDIIIPQIREQSRLAVSRTVEYILFKTKLNIQNLPAK